MVAGAVNRADDLFIHVGFCALVGDEQDAAGAGRSTATPTGSCPREGAAFVVLERLDDALRDGRTRSSA